MKRAAFLSVGLLLIFLAVGIRWSQPTTAATPPPFEDFFLAPVGQKPEHNWRVCRDLGIGAVPGLDIRRQRFRLCHSEGWEVLAYCQQPNLPAPAVGTRCSRISSNTFFCGSGIQRLREYSVQETPSPAPSPTPLPSSTPTPTTPVATSPPHQVTKPPSQRQSTPRAPAGGRGNFDLGYLFGLDWLSKPTSTPFQPLRRTPTPFQPHAPTQPVTGTTPEPLQGFYGLDLADPGHRVRILIFPPDEEVNQGKPILISFIPGQRCNYGDNRGCVNSYLSEAGAQVTFITVHSGMGGEGQSFRHAVEGTGINRAGLPLKEVRLNLQALQGAEVVILQGKRRYEGFTLAEASRLPARSMQAYFNTPIWDSLGYAAGYDQSLLGLADSAQPLLVFETCGWRMPGEVGGKGVTDTTASVYLGVIQKKP